ncbi:MAG: hypothetical protein AAGF89_02215, partial [Bacteroidota bacterium]
PSSVLDMGECTGPSIELDIDVLPVLDATVNTDSEVCEDGGTVDFDIDGTPGATVSYTLGADLSPSGAATVVLDGTGSATISATAMPATAGDYGITLTLIGLDGINGTANASCDAVLSASDAPVVLMSCLNSVPLVRIQTARHLTV